MTSPSKISELATTISTNTEIVNAYLSEHELAQPSFDADGPLNIAIPDHENVVKKAQAKVVSATLELHNLMKGPASALMSIALIEPNNILSLQAVSRLEISSKVPLQGGATYAELSQACNLNERDIRRLIRQAMTNHIFQEKNSRVHHTAASRLMLEDSHLSSLMSFMAEEYFPAAPKSLEALTTHNGIHTPSQSAFSLANNALLGLYDFLATSPPRARRFAAAMGAFADREPIAPIAAGFDFSLFSLIVDVGGGWGLVSIGLAERFPNAKFVVQDFAETVEEGREKVKRLGKGLEERIEFMEYNFLEEQPVKDADVYILRAIFHNWPEEYCVKILKNQLSGLKKGAHILVVETILADPEGEPLYLEKWRRSMDLTMLTYFGGQDRGAEDWQRIVEAADGNLQIKSIVPAPGANNHLILIMWKS